MSDTVLKRVVRRQTHSPRTVWTVVVLVLLIVGAAYVGTELILWIAGAAPLLVAPTVAVEWVLALPRAEPEAAVIAAGVVIMLVGLLLAWLALAPGRRAKHALAVGSESTGRAVVVDNGVIASALAEELRRELDVSAGGVTVGIGHRVADVTVRPEPGQHIERADLRSRAERALAAYDLTPRLSVRARVARRTEPQEA